MILTSIALAAALVSPVCEWANPRGTHAVTDVEPASLVYNYPEIPADVQHRLAQKMRARAFDDIVTIRKDSLTGLTGAQYTGLRHMHFGARGQKVCAQLTMESWTDKDEERGLVYCEAGHCVIVPTVCRNVSLITAPPPVAGPPMQVPPPEPTGDVPFAPPEVPVPGLELPPAVDLPPVEYDTTPPTFGRTWPPVENPEFRPFGFDLQPPVWGWPPLMGLRFDVTGVAVPTAAVVPELTTFLYFGLGLLGIALARKRFT